KGLKGNVARRRKRTDHLQERAERKSHPRNHHRPAFDAAMAVDSLFLRRQLQQIVKIERLWLADQAFDRNRPGSRDKIASLGGDRALICLELVQIVVDRDV